MLPGLERYREIWCLDFEFHQPDGERCRPLCLVALELRSGQAHRLWLTDTHLTRPPYDCGLDSLIVAYFASAEMGCHLALDWVMPSNVLDLYTEFRCATNGYELPHGKGLLGALAVYGLDGISTVEKTDMRDLAIRGGPYTCQERHDLLLYCETDVVALQHLLPAMLPTLDLPRALIRGRYMRAVACMETAGVPVDLAHLQRLRQQWPDIQAELVRRIAGPYGVYEGTTFKADRWQQWLARHGLPWPRLGSGQLDLSQDAFRDMARAYPIVTPIKELRATLGQLRLESITVGEDGRNRTLLSPFATKTSRNAPGTSKFVFGPAAWLRHLIRPETEQGLAYIDWKAAEIGIAGALSGDQALCAAYASGDPYMAFALQAGAAPPGASKVTHGALREVFKVAMLAVNYGMGPASLSLRLGQSIPYARELLELHRRTYRTFWQWSDRVQDQAMLAGHLQTVFGWRLHVASTPKTKPANTYRPALAYLETTGARTLRNFPAQANCAEALRLACCFATEAGVNVCAPVHDALLIAGPIDTLPDVVSRVQAYMRKASEIVLDGFALQSEAKCIHPPDHFTDERGTHMWETITSMTTDHHRASRQYI